MPVSWATAAVHMFALIELSVQASAGAVFEQAKPIMTDPGAFKVLFNTPDTPPNNPATISTGQTAFNSTAIQMKHISFEPCAIISAHIHPRASEWGYIIKGAIEFGMFLENKSHVAVTFEAGTGVVVPQGTVHYARNTLCSASEIVVIFDHPDPAVVYVAQALKSMSDGYLGAAFAGSFTTDDIAANQFAANICDCRG